MIIVPELQTVVILVPRTGSGAIKRAVLAAYPQAMLLYRHMEADGVPHGYDRWPKVGIVRHPVDRLWSLYKFLKRFDGDHDPAYIAAMRGSVEQPFSDWLVNDETVFTSPYDRALRGRYFAQFTVRHPIPETHKSQWDYLRPDLGTQVFQYGDIGRLEDRLGVTLDRHNQTNNEPLPPLSSSAREHVHRVCAWDFSAVGEGVAGGMRPEAQQPLFPKEAAE